MFIRIIKACLLIFGGILGGFSTPVLLKFTKDPISTLIINPVIAAILGAILFYFITFKLAVYVVRLIKLFEEKLVKAPLNKIIFGSLGLMIGLILSALLGYALHINDLPFIHSILPIFLVLIFGYLGFQVSLKKHKEFLNLFRKINRKKVPPKPLKKNIKILDSNVIIDGRIAGICQAGFLEGTIMIPQFVLLQIQHLADSSDPIKRNRGRRGLESLSKIQNELNKNLEIYEGDFEDIKEADTKLVKLANLTNGILVTNDYNISKICKLKNVNVLNINDLSQAVIAKVMPGDEIAIEVVKEGKEQNQGLGYLEDGTMIVVENGRRYIGKQIPVMITKILQKSSGRMIFASKK